MSYLLKVDWHSAIMISIIIVYSVTASNPSTVEFY